MQCTQSIRQLMKYLIDHSKIYVKYLRYRIPLFLEYGTVYLDVAGAKPCMKRFIYMDLFEKVLSIWDHCRLLTGTFSPGQFDLQDYLGLNSFLRSPRSFLQVYLALPKLF
jgi:hypothetical protein